MKKIILFISFALSSTLINAQCFVQLTGTNVTCNGYCDGTTTAFPVGIGPYTYTWMPGNYTTQNLTGLCPATYTLTMFDAGFSCTTTATITITQPAILNVTSSSSPASCPTCCDGVITTNAVGGTQPYSYVWTPSGGTGPVASNLCTGTYTYCVTDANSCPTMCGNLLVNFLTGIQSQAETGNFSVYPSLAAEFVTVEEMFPISTIAEISMINVLGQTVYTKCSGSAMKLHEKIDLSDLPNGIYFISVKTISGTTIRRIIKE